MAKGKDERHNSNRKVSKEALGNRYVEIGVGFDDVSDSEKTNQEHSVLRNDQATGKGMAGAITGAMDKMMRAKSPEDQAIYDDDQSAYLVGEIGKNLEAGGAKRIK